MTTRRADDAALLDRVASGYYKSEAFRRAFVRGGLACLAGQSIGLCPYLRTRGWGRAYQHAWKTGWRWAYGNVRRGS